MKRGAGALGLGILGAVFVPSWPIQLICFASIVLTLLSLLYAALSRRSLVVTRDASEIVAHAHAEVSVGLSIRNRSLLPLSWVSLTDHQGWGCARWGRPSHSYPSRPAAASCFSYVLKTLGRGVHGLGPITLASSDPLGLFPWHTSVPLECRVTVLPELGVVPDPPPTGSPGGEVGPRDPALEDTSRFLTVREYVRGDPPMRIHWKTTARLGSLHTVVYEPSLVAPCLVVLDLRLGGYPERSRYHFVERAVETAAGLVVRATREHQAVALVSNGVLEQGEARVGPGRGVEHALAVLGVLARIGPVEEPAREVLELAESMGGWAANTAGSRLCVVGPGPTPQTQEHLRKAVPGRLEIYRIAATGEPPGAARGVRVYTIRPYGEVLAGD